MKSQRPKYVGRIHALMSTWVAVLAATLWCGTDLCGHQAAEGDRGGNTWTATGGDGINLFASVSAASSQPPASEATENGTRVTSPPSNLVVDLGEGITMEFVLIPAGSFVMGSEESPLLDQKPAREVTISEPFYLGKYQVTQDQWMAVMGDIGNLSIYQPPLVPDTGNNPVENVSWQHCLMFLERLNEKIEDRRFRLPTEAEWEYACRAGTEGKRHFADADLSDFAWYSENADNRPHETGTREPNAWGLYDMYGNVWEWCSSFYDAYPGGTLPHGVSPGGYVMRGGAFDSQEEQLTSTFRNKGFPQHSDRNIGFRVAANAVLKEADD